MRIHVPAVESGAIVALDSQQARHALTVLRLRDGDAVEAFDADGRTGAAVLRHRGDAVEIEIASAQVDAGGLRVVVASAVPKGDRADWMIEKLGELGVERFIPLSTDRAVVVPTGQNKLARWRRLAQESARQSRRRGVMQIDGVTGVDRVLENHAGSRKLALTTEIAGAPLVDLAIDPGRDILLLIGPEGGWSDAELNGFAGAQVEAARLTRTILRVETAALAAAVVVLAREVRSA